MTRTSLGRRLQLLLALIAASVALVAVVDYVRTVSIEERISYLYDGRVVPLRELKAISDLHAIDVVDAVHKVVFGRFTPAEGAERLRAAAIGIDNAWEHYTHGALSPEDRRRVEETTPLFRVARRAVDEARAAMLAGDLPALDDFRKNRMYQQIDPLTVQLNALVQIQVQEVDEIARVARRDLRDSRNVSAAALAVAGLLALLVGSRFSRRLTSSLQAMQVVVRSAASGNLSARVALAGSDELAQMASDLDAMNESLGRASAALEVSEKKARAANEAKSVFLSSMSHELRTPLNVILGYAQLLRRTWPEGKDPRELENILAAGNHLLGLIDDVLAVSRVEAGTLTLRQAPFSPADLLRGVTSILGVQAMLKGLSLEVSPSSALPPRVLGDEGKLRQVLLNLIANAIKFTETGGVTVGVGYEKDALTVSVTDTGPGISEEERASLFETFYQGAAGRAAAIGSGLGLYISQTLVRLMQGEIRVMSAIGAGSTFSFTVALPLADRADAPEASTGHSVAEARPPIELLSPGERARLLSLLELGDLSEALRVTDTLDNPSQREQLRAIIETYRVDALIQALRRGASA